MSRISPYARATPVYQPGSPSAPSQGLPAAPNAAAPTAAEAATPRAPGVDPAEQALIDAYFPAQSPASMKLYSPGPGSTTVTPGALGTRLDVTG
ncbi:MAG: hypothetical protein AAF970_08730 [Bacteroidota bacterium]